jgi:hypothetical protein
MKVLKANMVRLYKGFGIAEILDQYASFFKDKYVNNEFLELSDDNYSKINGITELQKVQFLLCGLDIYAQTQEAPKNPYIRNELSYYAKSFLEDLERLKNGEKVEDDILFSLYFFYYKENMELFNNNKLIRELKSEINIFFIAFLITVLNSLYIDDIETKKRYSSNSILNNIKKFLSFKSIRDDKDLYENSVPSFIGVMDKISSNTYKKGKLTYRRKYVIIAKLIYLLFKNLKINNKSLLESSLHYIFWRLIDKEDDECDFLHKINKEGGYITFLNSKLYRYPLSVKATNDMYCAIEQLYEEREMVDRIAYLENYKEIIKKPPEIRKRKEWKKQTFINKLKSYKNQSEMANVNVNIISSGKERLNSPVF